MKCFFRNVIIFSLLITINCVFVFSQDTISSSDEIKDILTEKDVTSFIKNFDKIQKVLDEVDYQFDDSMTDFETLGAYNSVDNELGKLGISGPNRFYKIYAISICSSILTYEKEMAADPETAKMLKLYGIDPIEQLRSLVGKKDLSLVTKYQDKIASLIDIDE